MASRARMRVLSRHLRSENPQPEPCVAPQADSAAVPDVAREVTLSADELAFYEENGFLAVPGVVNGGGLFDYHQDNMYTRHDNGLRSLPRTDEGNDDGLGSCGIWVALHDLPDPENG